MSNSGAYKDFLSALQLAEALLKRESRYSDPAPHKSRKIVEALRGGASVLMVAAFENFLKELVEEYLAEMTQTPLRFDISRVPDEMRFSNVEYMVKAATQTKKGVKLNTYASMAKSITDGVMCASSFTEAVRSNPDADKLKELFKRVGVNDFYRLIKPDFDSDWTTPTAQTFISDTLDTILLRRHKVAHTANALNISRIDLWDAIRFLKVLGKVCDVHLDKHISQILSSTP